MPGPQLPSSGPERERVFADEAWGLGCSCYCHWYCLLSVVLVFLHFPSTALQGSLSFQTPKSSAPFLPRAHQPSWLGVTQGASWEDKKQGAYMCCFKLMWEEDKAWLSQSVPSHLHLITVDAVMFTHRRSLTHLRWALWQTVLNYWMLGIHCLLLTDHYYPIE